MSHISNSNSSQTAQPLLHARALIAAVLLPLAFTACAPDTSKTNRANDAFVDKVQRECGTKHLGLMTVSDLMNIGAPRYSAYFVDITSRYGQGKMSWEDYVRAVMTVNGGGGSDSAGLKCIQAQKS